MIFHNQGSKWWYSKC